MEKVTEKRPQVAEPQIAQPQANAHAADKDAELKAKKQASAKAWKERKDKEAAERKETAAKLIKYLADKKVELPAEYSKLLNDIANPAARSGSSNGGIFEKLFGSNPQVGQKVTLIEVFNKTYKSKAELDRAVKSWAEKGIIVEFESAANMLDSTYTIKKLA